MSWYPFDIQVCYINITVLEEDQNYVNFVRNDLILSTGQVPILNYKCTECAGCIYSCLREKVTNGFFEGDFDGSETFLTYKFPRAQH